ncbi:hypothetical protein [Microvirga sp. G4-2]|uniref:hypothetical protein n=1 Tax=Microvirga sp. G4-2 TaxID=3434467 RepID=UPI004044AC6F
MGRRLLLLGGLAAAIVTAPALAQTTGQAGVNMQSSVSMDASARDMMPKLQNQQAHDEVDKAYLEAQLQGHRPAPGAGALFAIELAEPRAYRHAGSHAEDDPVTALADAQEMARSTCRGAG